jgi:hypothetical protein
MRLQPLTALNVYQHDVHISDSQLFEVTGRRERLLGFPRILNIGGISLINAYVEHC